MKKSISLLALASILVAGTAYVLGYRIPEQSSDSVAKAGAHIASSTGADSSYYNPANMSWADNAWLTEIDLTYIYLAPTDYEIIELPYTAAGTTDLTKIENLEELAANSFKNGSNIDNPRPMTKDDVERSFEFFQSLPMDEKAYLRTDVTKRWVVKERINSMELGGVKRLVAVIDDKIVADGAIETE